LSQKLENFQTNKKKQVLAAMRADLFICWLGFSRPLWRIYESAFFVSIREAINQLIFNAMKKSILSFAVLLTAAGGVFAQVGVPFTVLTNNTDKAGKNLFVEIMYEKPACNDAQAKFFITYDNAGTRDTTPAVKVQVLNNPATFDEEAYRRSDSTTISRPTAAGYRLRVPLNGIKADQNPQLCVTSYSVAYRCVGCGAAGSDAIFNESSIRAGCPYDRSANNDLLACKQRTLRRGSEVLVDHWEAWILDPRDCQPYRIVYLRDGRWWFAQNLNYQKELAFSSTLAGADVTGFFSCPSGKSFFRDNVVATAAPGYADNDTTAAGTALSCKTYGALYSWFTAMALNGRTASATPVPLGQTSNVQGICPDGWFLPSDLDLATMLNAIEDSCSAPFDVVSAVPPCDHNRYRDVIALANLGATSGANIRATVSCPPHALPQDPICAKADRPAWGWVRADYSGKISKALAPANDKWGLSLLPAGVIGGTGNSGTGLGANMWASTDARGSNNHSTSAMRRYVENAQRHTGVRRSSTLKTYFGSVRCVR
jgi:uncharacterized protein (TIGR02145 family)